MPVQYPNILFGDIPCGVAVRKQLAHTYIYRVRRGNGAYGSNASIRYQDRYGYVVPSSINNPEGADARLALAQAVLNWQTALSAMEKAEWNRKAMQKGKTTGYAMYVGSYIRENV